MASKKRVVRKKKAASSPKKKELTAEEIFRSHALKLGIPEENAIFDEYDMHVTWAGAGERCSEILTAIEKKALENSFVRAATPEVEHPSDDPIVEELIKMELIPEKRRETILTKTSNGWTATIMMEHNLGDHAEGDTAIVLFMIEEED